MPRNLLSFADSNVHPKNKERIDELMGILEKNSGQMFNAKMLPRGWIADELFFDDLQYSTIQY